MKLDFLLSKAYDSSKKGQQLKSQWPTVSELDSFVQKKVFRYFLKSWTCDPANVERVLYHPAVIIRKVDITRKHSFT